VSQNSAASSGVENYGSICFFLLMEVSPLGAGHFSGRRKEALLATDPLTILSSLLS